MASSPVTAQSNAFVTLLTSDHYLPGALVLAQSLWRAHGLAKDADATPTERQPSAAKPKPFDVVALITPDTLSVQTVKALRRSGLFDWIVGVEQIGFRQLLATRTDESGSDGLVVNETLRAMEKNLALLGRPDLQDTLTKLHAWRLGRDSAASFPDFVTSVSDSAVWQGYDKVVFLDADMLVLRPIDHLFSLVSDPSFAASPDTGWPDAFNSGFMLLKPSQATFDSIRDFARQRGSWDGADQGLLNDFFGPATEEDQPVGASEVAPGGGWKRLSFRYNVTSHGGYTFAPAYQRYGNSIMASHFIGQHKPWNRPRPSGIADPNPHTEPQPDDGTLRIRPSQPDYLLALWYDTFASVYPSSAFGTPTSGIEIVHTSRGVEVIEKRTFTVPTYKAVWDAEATLGRERELEAFDQPRPAAVPEAQYHSLPLDGRASLIAPQPRTPTPPLVSPDLSRSPTQQTSPSDPATPTQQAQQGHQARHPQQAQQTQQAHQMHQTYQSHQTHQTPSTESTVERTAAAIAIPQKVETNKDDDEDASPSHFSPPQLSWDPAHAPPPTGDGEQFYQMRNPPDTYYQNAWDEHVRAPRTLAEQKAAFFMPPSSTAPSRDGAAPVGGPGYIPPSLKRDHVFDNLGSDRPDPSKIKPIFPWEHTKKAGVPTRVFPDEPKPPPPPPPPPAADPSSSKSDEPAATRTVIGFSTRASRTEWTAASPTLSAISTTSVVRRGLPSNLSYTNAWDEENAIGNFAKWWTKASTRGEGKEVGVQATPHVRHRSAQTGTRPGMAYAGTLTMDSGVSMYDPNADAGAGAQSDSRDGDDESSSDDDESDDDCDDAFDGRRAATRDGSGRPRSPTWTRESPGRGFRRKAEKSVVVQLNATPRSPRVTSRFSGSVSGGELRTASASGSFSGLMRAKHRIRPDGWNGSVEAMPPMSAEFVESGARVSREQAVAPIYYRRRSDASTEVPSRNSSGSGSGSGATSPSYPVILTRAPKLTSFSSRRMSGGIPSPIQTRTGREYGGAAAYTVASAIDASRPRSMTSQVQPTTPSGVDVPFSSSPVNSRAELDQQSRAHRNAYLSRQARSGFM
ncbi:glycogenin glucosyltransferase [Thecaphora frezii]